jgi:ribose/xylose/arabinose/galactoside ABC-type transport system permease subunit
MLKQPNVEKPDGASVSRYSENKVSSIWGAVKQTLLRAGPVIAFFLLAVYLSSASPHFLTGSNLINVARQTSITAILAISQTLVIITGGIDLSVGAVAAISASVAAVLMTQQFHLGSLVIGPIGFGWGILVAVIVGISAGAINGLLVTRGRIPDFIATMGTATAFRGVALLITGGLPIPSHVTATELKRYLPEEMVWLGNGNIFGLPVAGIIAILVVLVGWFILRYTVLGRSLFSVGGNREAARVSGINVDRTKVMVYVLSGLIAAIAGFVLAGRLNSANALMADGEELRSIAAAVIGGANLVGGDGGAIGSLIGALTMGILANGLNLLNVSAFWQRVVQGLVIISVVLFDQWRRRKFTL